MRAGEGGNRKRWLDGITYSMDLSLSTLQAIVMDRKPGALQSVGSKRLNNNRSLEPHGCPPQKAGGERSPPGSRGGMKK